ncbi:MAG: 2-oxoglutarate dehydrogenase E1 component [Ferrovum sp. 37-45-19]|uniref:2-oxoglutarate dehydrogenase E1 component n=1 Tax=Ferrovum sp. JA12 TaxID=1356299 RepID=UPI0007033B28|nr:2-oxoglutarate dehydrogenase E1 component [Ferrovum sp. JA12]OYV80286.1 MAG: 2-oxoglutarate dehydrogenase E1 component [Ferrovum sp. 21-44-67]OYV95032.1 MAG: 2-oxoglutarate dehydrogenase E1 component [Ferrovum sp. 37-45-19]OZB32211.1 MAG: 2-oxoglutarate dehydrogenase E1 component [Ferrovum sp. 34-44-207]HQT80912.1 2-oxoglutarate dehydrogenase E1 component [Ferrovaceae bacterium]KRH78754.1 2-oxoglutarate dehydrogenase E1 component [Ferrovum sp. JA12]
MFKDDLDSSYLFGSNAPFIEEQYELYLDNPDNVKEDWRRYFDELQKTSPTQAKDVIHSDILEHFAQYAKHKPSTTTVNLSHNPKQVAVLQLINAYRFLGNRIADLDPLQRHAPDSVPELDYHQYGLEDTDLDEQFDTGSLVGPARATLRNILTALKETYCGHVGIEYMYLTSTEQKRWIQGRFEGARSKIILSPEDKKSLLQHITAAETLERYLHTRYVGQKRFSLEGGESLIPIVNETIQRAGVFGTKEIVVGMAHRGRLNVLVNCLGKMPRDLFSEFEGKHSSELSSGDVKYHQGFSSDIKTSGGPVHLTLAFNPSHLEIVNPVVEGSVRARQDRRKDVHGDQVLPVLIHGDSAFAGQGVVMETMALSKTRGYATGGTLHIVINNQIGFTTSDPRDTRSTTYCTDIAKMIEAPVFHVNGDDPESVLLVTQVALDYRNTFHSDVIIDLVCYRRLGHNEQDEPMVTQPWMYKKINALPTTRKLYADLLESTSILEKGEGDKYVLAYRDALDAGVLLDQTVIQGYQSPFTLNWGIYKQTDWRANSSTALPLKVLKRLSEKITSIPNEYKLHPSVQRVVDNRKLMGKGELPLDWGMGETLAYASLIDEGYGIRLSGQDCGRGTFSHRHAVIHDQNRQSWDSGIFVPLQHIKENQPDFTVIDSILSEEAVLGFEYGYATTEPRNLIIWEAQFGDFANGAQVLIDQFISSGESKWGRLCGLTLLLPHGYEGQGPEHSSARLERYLQLCAEYNIQVCVPSNPAQVFHLLRRQMIRPMRKPLIVITPKSLLRRKEATSELKELTIGGFKTVIAETETLKDSHVERLVVCSGKVYYDIIAERKARNIDNIAVIRLEQLYPFPHDEFAAEVNKYSQAKTVVWAQEEPGNQGAWHRIQHYLNRHLLPHQKLLYALRPSSASPAVGYLAKHNEQQKALIDAALTLTA